jgi:hypothetical protein
MRDDVAQTLSLPCPHSCGHVFRRFSVCGLPRCHASACPSRKSRGNFQEGHEKLGRRPGLSVTPTEPRPPCQGAVFSAERSRSSPPGRPLTSNSTYVGITSWRASRTVLRRHAKRLSSCCDGRAPGNTAMSSPRTPAYRPAPFTRSSCDSAIKDFWNLAGKSRNARAGRRVMATG